MRIASWGQFFFAATMIVLGVLGLVRADFQPVWAPVPKGFPARGLWLHVFPWISIASGAGMTLGRTAAVAARLLLGSLVLWWLLARVPRLFLAPSSQDAWSGCGETAVFVAAAWVAYVWFATEWDKRHVGFATGERGLRIARTFYGLAMIVFGEAHFRYASQTASLVPGWLPMPLGWAYLTGVAYVAAGLAMLTGVQARLAAMLSALQMGLFTLLVWVPVIAAGSKDPYQASEAVLSWALTSAGWLMADSYRVKASSIDTGKWPE
jgi:uncharacterized membrane protein